MKKNQILAGMFLAGITLGACTDDYTDWANPQSNSPEDAPLTSSKVVNGLNCILIIMNAQI